MTNDDLDRLEALCAAAPTQLMCQAFRPGCENVATTFERGYALCVRCAREFLGYTPDVITYPIAFYDASRTALPALLAEVRRVGTENKRLREEHRQIEKILRYVLSHQDHLSVKMQQYLAVMLDA